MEKITLYDPQGNIEYEYIIDYEIETYVDSFGNWYTVTLYEDKLIQSVHSIGGLLIF